MAAVNFGPKITFDLLKGKKILIVDDFPQMRSSLKKMVESYGATDIQDARNGDDAVKIIAKNSFDIILCDYSLGENTKDGQQVLEEVKQRELIPGSTVYMMLTAESTVEMVMGAVEYKPDGYLTKPFTKEILVARLEKLLEKKAIFVDIEKTIKRKDFDGAMKLCDAKIKDNPKYMLDLLKFKSDILLDTLQFDEAGVLFEKVLGIKTVAWAQIGLGKIRFHQKEFMQARDLFQQVLDENESAVEAYDWLAKTYEELNDLAHAQEILQIAISKSPKAILRQLALGEVAMKNKDYEVAEKSFKATVKIGKQSCYKDPKHYTKLARVLSENKNPLEALKVIGAVREEYKDKNDASMQASMVEGIVYKKLGQEEKANACLDDALKMHERLGSKASVGDSMTLAQTCYELDAKDKGNNIMREVIRNHHEENGVLKNAKAIFKDMGMEEEGANLIENSRDEIVQLNNQGVKLVKDGKLEEAIEFFEKAAEHLPDNGTMNMNAAQALLMYMEKNGKNDQHLYKARQYLDRVGKSDPGHEKYRKLLKMYETVSAGK